jgi:hypothetical protein
VASDGKAPTGEPVDLGNAAAQVEDAAAAIAVEMVVMGLAGSFINRADPWDFHRNEPAFLEKGLDVSVNRSEARTLDVGLCRFQHLAS